MPALRTMLRSAIGLLPLTLLAGWFVSGSKSDAAATPIESVASAMQPLDTLPARPVVRMDGEGGGGGEGGGSDGK
jgi:hypothetical protein